MYIEYWKNKLDSKSKIYYDKMLSAFRLQKEHVECGDLDTNKIFEVYTAILNDHPELFYLSYAPQLQQVLSAYSVSNSILIHNIFNSREISNYNLNIQAVIKLLDKRIIDCNSCLDIERAICDYIIENTTYKINNKLNQNAATVLVAKQGQCSGIARAVKLLLDHYDIECIIVDGKGNGTKPDDVGPHSWNIVKIDGHYYHLDVTYMLGANCTKIKPFRYKYFNYSDKQISVDHFWDKSKLPQCVNVSNPQLESMHDNDSSDSCIVISSLYEIKQLLKQQIRYGLKSINFISNIASTDMNALMRSIQSTCQTVLQELACNLTLSISIQNGKVSISW